MAQPLIARTLTMDWGPFSLQPGAWTKARKPDRASTRTKSGDYLPKPLEMRGQYDHAGKLLLGKAVQTANSHQQSKTRKHQQGAKQNASDKQTQANRPKVAERFSKAPAVAPWGRKRAATAGELRSKRGHRSGFPFWEAASESVLAGCSTVLCGFLGEQQ